MAILKNILKQILFPAGERPCRIRGGALRGMRFYLDLRQDTQVWRGIYEQALQAWLVEHVKPEMICLDVGAAEGWATLLMARCAPEGKVYAFEPSPRGEWVQRNLRLNDSEGLADVSLHRVYVGAESNGSEFVTLDEFVAAQQLQRVDVIKVDVDGPENEVLDGAVDTLARFRPAVAVEVHSQDLLDGVLQRLHDAAYTTNVVEPPPHEHRPIEFNPMVFAQHNSTTGVCNGG